MKANTFRTPAATVRRPLLTRLFLLLVSIWLAIPASDRRLIICAVTYTACAALMLLFWVAVWFVAWYLYFYLHS